MKTTKSQSTPRKSAGRSSGSNSSSSRSSTRSTSSKKSSETSIEDTFRELFEAELKDIYWAEKALTKAIPKMIKNATDENLIAALEDHLAVTESQVSRVEEVFDIMGMEASAKKCEAMSGLIKEAEEIMGDTEEGPVRDAGIIAAAQKVEHYEIATYGTLRTWATILGNDEATAMLQEILDEEKDADQTLTGVAESVNIKAESETDGDDMDGGSKGESDGEEEKD